MIREDRQPWSDCQRIQRVYPHKWWYNTPNRQPLCGKWPLFKSMGLHSFPGACMLSPEPMRHIWIVQIPQDYYWLPTAMLQGRHPVEFWRGQILETAPGTMKDLSPRWPREPKWEWTFFFEIWVQEQSKIQWFLFFLPIQKATLVYPHGPTGSTVTLHFSQLWLWTPQAWQSLGTSPRKRRIVDSYSLPSGEVT